MFSCEDYFEKDTGNGECVVVRIILKKTSLNELQMKQ